MTPDWMAFLASQGARIAAETVCDFGAAQNERRAAATGSVLADLSPLALLEFRGADSHEFLHAQVSCDVKSLASDRSTYGSYNSAKGRMLASFLLWQHDGGYRMLLSRSLLATLRKRLQMFVLRAKVTIAEPEPAPVVIGVAGAAAASALASACDPVPPDAFGVARSSLCDILRLAGDRFILTAQLAAAEMLWNNLTRALTQAGTPCWEWLDIVNGVPLVNAATQDQFVPQMTNLELLGGVSFNKGCYPGQEIVARTQYLGKLKRRMYLARIDAEAAHAGDPLFSEDVGDQANGMILNAAPAPEGGMDVLAVVQSASAAQSTVHLGSPSGPTLQFRALPYAIP